MVDPGVRFGVISDIDDTVMVTALPRPLLAAWNTFVLDEHARMAVPGMAVLYERLVTAHPGAPVFYLSTGAWNVAPTLTRFLSRHLYPAGPLLLTDWGPTAGPLVPQRPGTQAHHAAPGWPPSSRTSAGCSIGDDGQHDQEIYSEFAHAHPENVAGGGDPPAVADPGRPGRCRSRPVGQPRSGRLRRQDVVLRARRRRTMVAAAGHRCGVVIRPGLGPPPRPPARAAARGSRPACTPAARRSARATTTPVAATPASPAKPATFHHRIC